MRVGITGHQALDRPDGWPVIRTLLAEQLREAGPHLVGLSSLAQGADQLFAQEVIALKGALIAVLPFADYRALLPQLNRELYDELLTRSERVVTLPRRSSDETSFMFAGRYIVDHCDLLIAVWDQRPAIGYGGTADVVDYATRRQRAIRIVDASPWRHGHVAH